MTYLLHRLRAALAAWDILLLPGPLLRGHWASAGPALSRPAHHPCAADR